MSKLKRTILTFEPDASKSMILEELKHRKKRKEKGALRNLLEEAVIGMLGKKYPKLCPPDLATTHPSLFLALQGSKNPTSSK